MSSINLDVGFFQETRHLQDYNADELLKSTTEEKKIVQSEWVRAQIQELSTRANLLGPISGFEWALSIAEKDSDGEQMLKTDTVMEYLVRWYNGPNTRGRAAALNKLSEKIQDAIKTAARKGATLMKPDERPEERTIEMARVLPRGTEM